MTIRMTLLEELVPHPDNPRKGDVEKIARAIRRRGFHGALVAQSSTNRIIAGEHRWRALQLLGGRPIFGEDGVTIVDFAPDVPVDWVDDDDAAAVERLLSDNRASDDADYDGEVLAGLLRSMPDPSAALWDAPDVDALLKSVAPPESAEGSTTRESASLKDMADNYGGAAVRQMIIGYARDHYQWVTARMAELRESRGIDSNAGLIMALLADASGKKPPK